MKTKEYDFDASTLPVFVFVLLSSLLFIPSPSFLVPSLFRSFSVSSPPSLSPPPLCVVFLTSVHFELVEQRLDLRHGAVHDGVEARRRWQLCRRDLPRQHVELTLIQV